MTDDPRLTAVELLLSMRSYSPACAVWINGRRVQPTEAEEESYRAKIADIMKKDVECRAQPVDDTEDEAQQVEVAEIEQPEVPTMLIDPAMFESDVDI